MEDYTRTRAACYTGFVVQAVVNNLPPLLFLTYQRRFGLELNQLALLASLNFGAQLLMDALAVKFADKVNYRTLTVAAHLFACAGLLGLGLFPFFMPPYLGLALAMFTSAIGSGIIEVIISPLSEALPGRRKAASMAFLHSFYCWGCVAVVGLSALCFAFAQEAWQLLPILWALVPLASALLFARVPPPAARSGKAGAPARGRPAARALLPFFILMVCAGASELAMAQWASLFAEASLGISKTAGDLLGPCAFAALMGVSRIFIGLRRGEVRLERYLAGGGVLCALGFALASLSPWAGLSLAGCALCGLAAGLMWPGVLSLGSRAFPQGGTALFAALALAGDMGCSIGPGFVGLMAGFAQSAAQSEAAALKFGLLFAAVFPAAFALCVLLLFRRRVRGERGAPPSPRGQGE